MMKMKKICRVVLLAAAMTAVVAPPTLRATPYASELTNNNGTIQFYLNESNAVVQVTYTDDGTTNASFDGITTGTNCLKGVQSFSLAGHSGYKILVTKNGSGLASLLATHAVSASRGVDVNKIPNSPNFGQVYACISTVAYTNAALRRLNSDMTLINTNSGGVAWVTGSGSSPYRLAVNDDGYLTVGDFASAHSGVWRIDPTLSSNQLVLGPISDAAGSTANSHGSEFSRPLLIGNLQSGGSAVMYTVDAGNFPFNAAALNSILVYSNLTLANLPRITQPDLLGPETTFSLVLNNNYPGITVAGHYLYISNRRDTPSTPEVQVYDLNNNYAQVWNSLYNGGNSDYFIINGLGFGDGAVSADGKFFAGVGITDNHITVCALTNGIPDVSTIYTVVNSVTTSQARGICFDAADNVYVSSSGVGGIQEWSLGFTAKAITTGNTTGQTNFALVFPSTEVSVTAVTNMASQSGPTAGVFTITRSSTVSADTNSALTVFYALTGTATNGTYTVSGGTTTSVTFLPGQNSTNIIITPVNDGLPRPTTTVILTLSGRGSYGTMVPVTDTVFIQNTGPEAVFISQVVAPSMYKGLTNDFASFVITRYGDTNNNGNSFTVSSFTYGGTATNGIQYVPAQPITFDPGVISITNIISPLINETNYEGNKTVTVTLGSGSGYTIYSNNTVTLTIIDNATRPATVLWSNPLTDPNDAGHWNVNSANNDMASIGVDNTIEFGYDLTANNPEGFNNGYISLPPNGATNCLRVTVNKNSGYAAGVNLYPNNVTFSGDYAVRFDMNIAEGDSASYTTEGPLFGINHTGIFTNWWSGSGLLSGWDAANTSSNWSSDGVWYWISADGGATLGDYLQFTGLGGTNYNTGWAPPVAGLRATYANIFKDPTPYSTLNGTTPASGLPANSSPFNAYSASVGYTNSWANVEIKTAKNVVTMSINKTVISTYTNTTVWTNGTLMLGYDDPFSSIGGPDGAVYFSNIRVVRLVAPTFTLQPANLSVGVGSNATLAVALSFDSSSVNTNGQWSFNGTAIAGATNYTYSFTVQTNSFGTYAFSLNDGSFSIVSSNAVLTPPVPVIASVLPATRAGAPGGAASFTVTASTFSGVTNYQWLSNSVSISGATSKALALSNLQSGNFGSLYTVSVNDGVTSVTSSPAVTITRAVSQSMVSNGLASGKFRMSFNTEVGPSYVVAYKTNLLQATWLPIVTNAGTGGLLNVTNANATNSQGYYRLQLQ